MRNKEFMDVCLDYIRTWVKAQNLLMELLKVGIKGDEEIFANKLP